MSKYILYIDMNNVLVDFSSAFNKLDKAMSDFYQEKDNIPHIFSLMEPVQGAVEAFHFLSKHFDTYIISTAPWENPTAWADKLEWVKKHLGEDAHKRLILTHHKDLNKGDFLIEDRMDHSGVRRFGGKLIKFDPFVPYPWVSVLDYMKRFI